MNEAAILQRLERIEKNILLLLGQKKKKTWVKSTQVTKLTGWTSNQMRQMREHGIINWKRDGGFFYELESIPKEFLKQQA